MHWYYAYMADTSESIRLDATALKVLAHPLRARLLGALRHRGRATATELAADLETNSGATSYHLRRLEEVALVRDTGEGAGRRRLWEPTTQYHSYHPSDFADDDDAEAALGWLTRDYVRHLATRQERWIDVQATWPLAWRDAAGLSDDMVVVTAEQMRALADELNEVIRRYRRVGQGNPQARRVAVFFGAHPIDMGQAPRR